MKRRLLALFLLLVTIGVGGALFLTLRDPERGPRDPAWERIQAEGVLRVGVDPSLPPFGFFGADAPTGLDPDLALALGQRLGLEVQFTVLSFDGLYDALLLGVVDVVIAALRPEPLRMDRVAYTPPYIDAGHVIVARDPAPRTLEALAGYRVAVEFASEGDLALRRVADVSIERFLTAQEALQALEAGRVQAALLDRLSVNAYAPPNFEVTAPVLPDPYVIALRRTDWRLIGALEAALAQLHKDGTLSRLVAAWLEG